MICPLFEVALYQLQSRLSLLQNTILVFAPEEYVV
jgi:hypothetical protein